MTLEPDLTEIVTRRRVRRVGVAWVEAEMVEVVSCEPKSFFIPGLYVNKTFLVEKGWIQDQAHDGLTFWKREIN